MVLYMTFTTTTKAASSQPTSPNLSHHSQDKFWPQLDKAKENIQQNNVNEAINNCQRASTLAQSGMEHIWLIWEWEAILEKRPFDPKIHLALASAFNKSWNPELTTWEAEMHCKRAMYLSPDHQNADAAALLEIILHHRKTMKRLGRSEMGARLEEFRNELTRKWKPPSSNGFLLARARVIVNRKNDIKTLSITCPSGNESFDQSAAESLRSAHYSILNGSAVPGMLDFTFVSDDNKACLDFTVDGSSVIEDD